MRKTKLEWLLPLISVTLTLVLTLLIIRYFAPQLLGIPADLQLVRVNEQISPFFENVFRKEDFRSNDFILKDPHILRARPLFPRLSPVGPNDILGFRNHHIPNVADIVPIGDSQTYGRNAILERNWPNQLAGLLGSKKPVIYSMAVGGWGAIEYMEMVKIAALFQPRVVIVAFYTGNDPLESFLKAYSHEKWAFLRPDPNLSPSNVPSMTFPPRKSELWPVQFRDGTATTFTPFLRLGSNQDHPAVQAGYAVMAHVARVILRIAKRLDLKVLFTIIPTKELVYAEKVMRDGIEAPKEFRTLVRNEEKNLNQLRAEIEKIPNAQYVDLLLPLQRAALMAKNLYPTNWDGHPIESGYAVIAESMKTTVDKHIPLKPLGLVAVMESKDRFNLFLIRNNGVWRFANMEVCAGNGWRDMKVNVVRHRDIATLPWHGVIRDVDPSRFGPKAGIESWGH